MANFYGTTRSNYFAVKDPEAFVNELVNYPVEVISQLQIDEDGKPADTLYGFIDSDDNGGGDIWTIWNEEDDSYGEVDWADVFKRHLQDDWVAIIQSVGAEKHRFLSGSAVLFNNKGETHSVNLNSIYTFADVFGYGEHITRAEY